MPTPHALRSTSDSSLQTVPSWAIGRSSLIRGLFDAVQRIADSTSPVLLVGEPGSGKEAVARTLHHRSVRRQGPFVVIDCTALADGIADARPDRRTPVESAHGGTLYLENVGDLGPRAQGDLLRVIEEKSFPETASASPRRLDARVIAATPIDLQPAVRAGKFREDLYRRLNAATLTVPALRERHDDIPLLVAHMLDRLNRSHPSPTAVAPEAMARLVEYPWPGNLRELETLIERLSELPTGPVIHVTDLPPDMRADARPDALAENVRHGAISLTQAVDAFERELIVDALERTAHVQVRAAKQLGITRRILKYKMDLLGIPVKRPRARARREAA
ncbi:MAG: sigma 54-interacting transcriptional regulator [Nitrospirota bacterium]